MKTFVQLLCWLQILFVSACDRDSVRRLAYGTVQNMGQQRCMDTTLSSQWNDCIKSQSYDDYQRKREELAKPVSGAPSN